jgi:hypothetical protein
MEDLVSVLPSKNQYWRSNWPNLENPSCLSSRTVPARASDLKHVCHGCGTRVFRPGASSASLQFKFSIWSWGSAYYYRRTDILSLKIHLCNSTIARLDPASAPQIPEVILLKDPDEV